MPEDLKQVLIDRTDTKVQSQLWEAGSSNGYHDLEGNTLIVGRDFLDDDQLGNPNFDGDPRVATKEEINAAGLKLKESEEGKGTRGFIKGKSSKDKDALEIEYIDKPDTEENTRKLEQAKDALYTTYYSGLQIQSDKNHFPEFKNEFSSPLTEAQEKQISQLEQIAAGIGVRIRHFGDLPYYDKKVDMISLPTKDHFNSPEEYMQTLAHELIHATQNKAPQFNVDNIPKAGRGDYNYGMEEWRAELGSVVLMTGVGASFDTKNSASYIHEWSDSRRWSEELTVEDRELKIMQAIEAANFLREKAGLNKVEFSEKEIQELKEINAAFPDLPKSLLKEHDKSAIEGEPKVSQKVQDIYNKLNEGLAPQLAEKGAEKWTAPMLAEATYACVEKGLSADKIGCMGINDENNTIYAVAKSYYPFIVIDAASAAKSEPNERLQEANQLQNELTQQMEQKELDRQLQLAQQQERGGRSFG